MKITPHSALSFLANTVRQSPRYAWLYAMRFDGLSDDEIEYLISRQFKSVMGYWPNLKNPKTLNEKIQWLKIHIRDPLMTTCADKVLAREYVASNIGEHYLVPGLGVYENPNEIKVEELPTRFVLKVNWGSGQNIICKDKNTFDFRLAKKQLLKWMQPSANHYYDFLEWCYKDIEPKILAEQYIEQLDGYLVDYKFHVFNGKPVLLQFIDRWESHRETIYTIDDWKPTGLHFTYDLLDRDFQFTENIKTMIGLCEKLAKPFPYVRVDFYETCNRILFGELTFYPGNGELSMPDEWNNRLGNMLELPR